MRDSVIVVNDIRKACCNFMAVDGISFDVNQGEIFGLLGPHGAGNSSMLESLGGAALSRWRFAFGSRRRPRASRENCAM